jgi:hypothetical protein
VIAPPTIASSPDGSAATADARPTNSSAAAVGGSRSRASISVVSNASRCTRAPQCSADRKSRERIAAQPLGCAVRRARAATADAYAFRNIMRMRCSMFWV